MTPDQQPLTKQDLREALDALVQTLSTRFDAIAAKQDATDSRLDAAVQALNARLDATDSRLDAAVQALSARLDAGLSRLDAAVQALRARLDATDSRLDAAVQALSARLDATDSRLDAAVEALSARLDAAVQTLSARQDRMVEAFAHNLTELRGELLPQLELLQNRTERTELNISSILIQLGGINKALGQLDRSGAQAASTQAAQQRAIDDLYAQIAELKRLLLPPQ